MSDQGGQPNELPSKSAGLAASPPRVPDYELLRCVGRGSYGEVWLARSVMGTYRAVKVVYRKSFDNERPFEREFNGIKKFEPISRLHESQVDILHVGRSEDSFYYVMELADDVVTGQEITPDRYSPKTVKSELFKRGRLPFAECLRISVALTTALEHLHGKGLVHRDIKPSNIIFVQGVPKLADIGLVTSVDATRSYVGTEGFFPPEGPGTPQADIYSLGKVLYEICTGRDREDFPELPTELAELQERENLLELIAVVSKACKSEPRQRYASARDMRQDLECLQHGKSVRHARSQRRRMAALFKVGICGVAAVGLLCWGVYSGWFLPATKSFAGRDGKAIYEWQCAKCHGTDGKGHTTMGQKLGAKDYTEPETWEGLTDQKAMQAVMEGIKIGDKVLMRAPEQFHRVEARLALEHMRTFKQVRKTAFEQWSPTIIVTPELKGDALVAKVPGGPQIEVLAISDANQANHAFWTPNGLPITHAQYEIVSQPESSKANKSIVISISTNDLGQGASGPEVEPPGEQVPVFGGFSSVRKNGEILPDAYAIRLMCPRDLHIVNLRFTAPAGNPRIISTVGPHIPGDVPTLSPGGPFSSICWYEALDSGSDAHVSLLLFADVKFWSAEVSAIGTNGIQHIGYNNGVYPMGKGTLLGFIFNNLSLTTVKELRALIQPKYFIEFRNIALEPLSSHPH